MSAALLCLAPGLVAFSLVGLTLADLWRAIRRPLLCSVLMCGAVAATGACLPEPWPMGLRLAVLVAEGVALQALLCLALDRDQTTELLSMLRGRAPAEG